MHAQRNVRLQLAALAVFVLFRLQTGFLAVAFLLSVVGPILAAAPLLLALASAHRKRLTTTQTRQFAGLACTLMTASACIGFEFDGRLHMPVLTLVFPDGVAPWSLWILLHWAGLLAGAVFVCLLGLTAAGRPWRADHI